MRFEVLVLGNSSATPMYERHPSAQVINYNEQLFLLDCGEGTQSQLIRYGIKSSRISHIFISHLHGDHYLGLVGLISSMHLVGRKSDLHVYGPAGLKDILDMHLLYSGTKLRYILHFHPTNPLNPEVILDTSTIKVSTFPLYHRIECTGFRFDEGRLPAKLNIEMVDRLGIPRSLLSMIKRGAGFTDKEGREYPNSELTFPAPVSRSYAYCSDTVKTDLYWGSISGVDLLYHEATFLQEMSDRAKETFHTTAFEAGEIASAVGAKKLLLGHYSARYKKKELYQLLDEAQSVFPSTVLSVEGQWYEV